MYIISIIFTIAFGIFIHFTFQLWQLTALYTIWSIAGIWIGILFFQIFQRVEGDLKHTPLNVFLVLIGCICSGPLFWIYGFIIMVVWLTMLLIGRKMF